MPSPGLPDAPRAGVPRQPVFVGGTGRSGTKILGELLARSTAYALVERELHFHADPGGLTDALAGRLDVALFVERMRGFWYRRPSPDGGSRGLFWLLPATSLDPMLQRFADAFEHDRTRACASLLDQVVASHPVAEGRAWIERTPRNAQVAPWLLSMFPRAAVLNMVRSGLDVASSLTEQHWAPDDINDCLLWWADQYLRAELALRRMPPGTFATVHLEHLVRDDKEGTYLRLLTTLGIEDEPAMRRFLETGITAQGAHIGRWREAKSPGDCESLMVLYGQLLRRMREAGAVNLPLDATQAMRDADQASSVPVLSSRLRTWRWKLWRRRLWQAPLRTRLSRKLRDVVSSRPGEHSHR
jgi:Sulfotransferase family